MKTIKIIFVYLFFGLSFLLRGQSIANYVTNGGFEKYTSCNVSYSLTTYVANAIGWDEIDNNMSTKWNNYCYGSVPFNAFFYNYPRSDSAYVILDAYCLTCSPNSNRTNVRNALKTNLLSGKTYCVKFYINNSEYSGYNIDAFDAYFGGNELDTITKAHIPLSYLTPQIKNPKYNYITDTIGWTMISGTFTANGTEKYMVVGNLRSDALTDTIVNNLQAAQTWSACTVALDDVSCIPIDLPAFAGKDTSCAPGTSIYLGRQCDVGIDEDCMWYKLPNITTAIDTAAGIWVKPVVTTTYVVRQEICGYVKWDTVVVYMNPVGIDKLHHLSDNINLFPNPTSGNLSISGFSGSDISSFSISNCLGQNIQIGNFIQKNNLISIETSELESGLYQIHLKTQYGIVTKKFVKTN